MEDGQENGGGGDENNEALPPPPAAAGLEQQQQQPLQRQLPTLHRALRTRRSSSSSSASSTSSCSGMISSTTQSSSSSSSTFCVPPAVSVAVAGSSSRILLSNRLLAASLRSTTTTSSSSSSSSLNSSSSLMPPNGNVHVAQAGEDDVVSSCQPSSSQQQQQQHFMPPSPRVRPSAAAGSSRGGAAAAAAGRPSSPLGSPDSTFWSPSTPLSSSQYRMGPPTPGGLCQVSSSTSDDVPASPLASFQAEDLMGGIVGLSNEVRRSSSNNSSSNSLILNSLISAPALSAVPQIAVAPPPPASSSSSSGSSSSIMRPMLSSSGLSLSFGGVRSKIKKASSFERFSMQQAATSQQQQQQLQQQQQQPNIVEVPVPAPGPSKVTEGGGVKLISSQNQVVVRSSKILWESLMSGGGGGETSNGVGNSVSNNMKMPNKKRVAKIAIEQEEMQMQQQQQQQNENMISLLNQNVLHNPSNSLMNEAIDHLMNDVGADNDGFMRELSNSPLNLTEANSEGQRQRLQPVVASSAVTAASTSNSGIINSSVSNGSIKKIPLAPKQKFTAMYRLESGEMTSAAAAATAPQPQVSPTNMGFNVQQQQSLLQITDCLQQPQHQGALPEQQQQQQQLVVDNYMYDSILKGRDDFMVTDNLGGLSKSDGAGDVNVLYDQDNIPYYYYPGDLQDEFFSTSTAGLSTATSGQSSSRSNMLLLPQQQLQDTVDSMHSQGHANVDFMIGLDDQGIERQIDLGSQQQSQQQQQQQQFQDPNDVVKAQTSAQAESTLRNLLMMGPIQTHDETWMTDYQQHQTLSGSSRSRQSSIMNPAPSNGSILNQGLSAGTSSALQNALNNAWMMNSAEWQRSASWASGDVGGGGHHDDIQDEVMDMSIMDSPDKHHSSSSANKRQMHGANDDDDGVLLESLQPTLGMPLSTISSSSTSTTTTMLINSKGQQIVLHNNPNEDLALDPSPMNLQQHHHSVSSLSLHHHSGRSIHHEDEPVNLMSGGALDEVHHQHSSSHPAVRYHSSASSSMHHHVHGHQQLPVEDDDDHYQQHRSVVSHRHLTESLSQQQQQKNERYFGEILPEGMQDVGNDYQFQTSDPVGDLEAACLESAQDVIHQASIAFLSGGHQESESSEVQSEGINIGERRVIRIKKPKDAMLTSIDLANSTFQQDSPTKAVLSRGANVILDKAVLPKSVASLPSPLSLSRVAGGGVAVFTARYKTIAANTRFGPVEGPLKPILSKDDISNADTTYPCMIMLDSSSSLWQLDRSDDELCNWMKFVRVAKSPADSNALVVEDRGLLYFQTTKEIPPKTELQVMYSVEYAEKHGLSCFALNSQQQPPAQLTSEQTSVITSQASSLAKASLPVHTLHTSAKVPDSVRKQEVEFVEVYPCFECSEHFGSRDLLMDHLDNAHAETRETPKKTKKRFLKKMNLAASKVAVEVANPSSATILMKRTAVMPEGGAAEVPVAMKVGRHECTSCKATLPSLVDLTKHYASHHFEKDEMGVVDSSNVAPVTAVKSKPMRRMTVQEEPSSSTRADGTSGVEAEVSTATPTVEAPPAKVKCSMCYKSFANKERLEKHMIVHSAEETKPLKCQFCPKRFLTNSALAGHVKTHAEEGKCFECPMCTFVTTQLLQLKEHVQGHKNKDTGMFHCPRCTKRFGAYSMVRKHIRAFHGPRQFGCSECTMNFPTADKLKLHQLKHSDHREFLCAECGRQFKRKDKLREHHKRMHENKKKPPTMDIQSAAGELVAAAKHRFTNKKVIPKTAPEEFEKFVYKCVECMMGFKRRGMLVNHLAKRHPDKPREQVPELNMPILRPSRNYFCPYCERVYKSSSKRKSHILKSHPGKPVPPQLKGKDSLTVNDGEKLITVSVNSVLSSSNELKSILSAGAAAGKSKDSAAAIQNALSIVSSDNRKQMIETTASDQPKIFSAQPFREVSVVGKVMANPHACTWCHRQYATRAKLLQHQRKSHLQLMPADMQQPRTQKNNVNRDKDDEMAQEQPAADTTEEPAKKKLKKFSSAKAKHMKKQASKAAKSELVVTPDSSTPNILEKTSSKIEVMTGNNNADSSTGSVQQSPASTTTTTTITLNEHQLQQLQLHGNLGSATEEGGNVIGFLLTTTSLNSNGELSGLVPTDIVVVPVNSHQLQQQATSPVSSRSSNNAAIQQAILSTTNEMMHSKGTGDIVDPTIPTSSASSSNFLSSSSDNSNILTNVISSAVNGL